MIDMDKVVELLQRIDRVQAKLFPSRRYSAQFELDGAGYGGIAIYWDEYIHIWSNLQEAHETIEWLLSLSDDELEYELKD